MIPQVQFLEKVVDVPVVRNVRCSKGSCFSLRVLLKEFLVFLRDGEPGSRGRFSFRLEI